MGRARAAAIVELPPAEALERFADVRAWGSFVDGFARSRELSGSWPVEGSEVTWESTPGGRGTVHERIETYEAPPPAPDVAPQSTPGRLVTRVDDDGLTGVQTATFAPHGAGTRLDLELEYELKRRGALSGITDALFIRRAVRDSLRRTVERFASDASRSEGERRPHG